MSDIFQEVEEDVRRERYEQLWKKYGNYVIAAAALLVLAVGGYQAWSAYDTNQRQAVSDQYQAAQTIAATDAAKAEAEFTELSKSGYSGYATLSTFNLAAAYLAQGKRDPAIALLRELTASSDDAVSSVARLRLAWAEADAQLRTEIETILQPLMAEDNPWRFAANEILAYVDFRTGSRARAEADYLRLSQEQQASPSLRQRAAAIVQYLKANPAAGPAAPAAPAPAGAPAPAPTQGTTK
jgi:hypothetical protein